MQIRPTSDRLRETLFNVLSPRLNEETRFLDLCAGSGAVGIEALSRGVAFVNFVDHSRKMCGLIESNLDLCGVPEDQTEVVLSEAADYLKRVSQTGESLWEVVFFDPPYAHDYTPVLNLLGGAAAHLINDEGIVIAEHHHKTVLPDLTGTLRRWRILRQGDSALSFYEKETDGV